MQTEEDISKILADLQDLAPAGYALALHIRFTTPTFLFQTYPKAWSDYYSQNGLVMSDPTVAWGFENLGQKRWSELAQNDPAGVMAKAAEYDLRFGVTVALEESESRTLASCARSDRELTEAEIDEVAGLIGKLHVITGQLQTLSPDTAQKLRKMAVEVGPGDG